MNTIHTLDIAGLEQVYDRLATAIDEAGPEKSELFLVKLALLNAKAMGKPALFEAQVISALKDLPN
jgi:sulfur relay (sulfurtransferase) complex TusBCD TusD component (DsrE family)